MDKVQWHHEEDKSCLQQQTELEKTIGELWELMQISKKSYSIMKKLVHREDVRKVKNN